MNPFEADTLKKLKIEKIKKLTSITVWLSSFTWFWSSTGSESWSSDFREKSFPASTLFYKVKITN
jgi:hypothetical protein